ncbi:hypothetical protein MYP_3619 [Sporocytophaga myxococcoides]|uniref:Uncharacterized protein n=1 Tax=Sporocytophaga myxococcoides TaxID=153721 RepID=A0A098LHH1_9BACT|nr:hypothetical protein MYP_3619 [Sporocytophaga myxococcoides]
MEQDVFLLLKDYYSLKSERQKILAQYCTNSKKNRPSELDEIEQKMQSLFEIIKKDCRNSYY